MLLKLLIYMEMLDMFYLIKYIYQEEIKYYSTVIN